MKYSRGGCTFAARHVWKVACLQKDQLARTSGCIRVSDYHFNTRLLHYPIYRKHFWRSISEEFLAGVGTKHSCWSLRFTIVRMEMSWKKKKKYVERASIAQEKEKK